MKMHMQDITHVQEPRTSIHKRVTRTVVTTTLPFTASNSRTHVNHARELEVVQPARVESLFFYLFYCILQTQWSFL